MPAIRNKLNQRLIINLIGGKNIDLLARGTANVSEKEFSSSHLQALIEKGDIAVISTPIKTEKIKTEIVRNTEIYDKISEQTKEKEPETEREMKFEKKQPQKRRLRK